MGIRLFDLPEEMSESDGQVSFGELDEEVGEMLWTVLRPGILVSFFVIGWAINLSVFIRSRIDYCHVLGISKDQDVSPQRLMVLAFGIGMAFSFWRLTLLAAVPPALVLWSVLLSYVLSIGSLYVWMPAWLARQVRWRIPLGRALWRCIWPDRSKEVPFAEVLVADGLTSLAKAFFDLALSSCVAISLRQEALGLAPVTSAWMDELHLTHVAAETLTETSTRQVGSSLSAALAECKRSQLPFLAWSLPFLIRARQCMVTISNSADHTARDMQRINLLKYASALPIIVFAFCLAQSGEHPSWLVFGAAELEAMWAIAATINSVFSSAWDIIMDWGLLQPGAQHAIHVGLRPVLVFRGKSGFYHIAILCNLVGRALWSLRWSSQATAFFGAFLLPSLQQGAEVVRRCLWNVLRVEWEYVKHGLHRSDKQFPV